MLQPRHEWKHAFGFKPRSADGEGVQDSAAMATGDEVVNRFRGGEVNRMWLVLLGLAQHLLM